MTSSLKRTMWNRSLFWSFAIALILLAVSGFVGLSDDEAYYWVLAQKPALGYAYHPPMIAWMIHASQAVLGGVFGESSSLVVRFFSCSCMGLLVAFSMDWVRRVSSILKMESPSVPRSVLALVSFAGVFGLGWMMVPDVPLFLGWLLAFYASWRIAFEAEEKAWLYVLLGAGVALAMLGKYSGVLVPASVVFAVFAGPEGRRRFWKVFGAATIGAILALIPILIWNSQHEWQSILYQIHGRHEDSDISLKRYLRFWLIELAAAGPLLLPYTFGVLYRAFGSRREDSPARPHLRFISAWIIPPAAIFCLQPLFSDFKPHWAFIVWLPGAIALAWEASSRKVRLLGVQIVYGLTLIAIVLVGMHFPVLSFAIRDFKGKSFDPRWDPTNDLYGWNRLAEYVKAHRASDGSLPYVVASRYQTASRSAAALGSVEHVSLVPRDLKARDEWPVLPVSDTVGPDWPKLTAPVLYVGDNRYDEPPGYRQSRCEPPVALDTFRSGILAKRILVWVCNPL